VLTTESFALLRLLNAQEPCAGHRLAEKLNVSRNRISALIEEVESIGVEVLRVSGKGFMLKHPMPSFDLEAWRAAMYEKGAIPPESRKKLPPHTLTCLYPMPEKAGDEAESNNQLLSLQWMEQVDSTSNELLRRGARHDIHGQALVTEWQSEGRGRRGRSWTSVPGGSLLFSYGWKFEQGGGYLSGLSLAMSVAVLRALEAEGFTGLQLKWPNDIVYRYQKVGGILIELSGDALGPTQAVIGVGLNLNLSRSARHNISQAVSDLTKVAGKNSPLVPPDRQKILASIMVELSKALAMYSKKGFVAFMSEWHRRHIYHNCDVRLLLPDGQVIKGLVVGVDANGALVLDEGHSRTRHTAGEVSLRTK
jgi:BirA family biotin operon repressor/biotin-[acetyl-CoA-carboxylase] ligase